METATTGILSWITEQVPVVVVALAWIYTLLRSNTALTSDLRDALAENRKLTKETLKAEWQIGQALAAQTKALRGLQQLIQQTLLIDRYQKGVDDTDHGNF